MINLSLVGLTHTKLTTLSIGAIATISSLVTGLSTALIYKSLEKPLAEKTEVDTLRGVVRRQYQLQEKIDLANVTVGALRYICSKYVIEECVENYIEDDSDLE